MTEVQGDFFSGSPLRDIPELLLSGNDEILKATIEEIEARFQTDGVQERVSSIIICPKCDEPNVIRNTRAGKRLVCNCPSE